MDFGAALERKYEIMGQEASARSRLADAQAGLTGAQTAAYPQESAARAYAERGAGFNAFAGGNLQNVNAGLAPGLAGAEEAQRYGAAQGSIADAYARRYSTIPFAAGGYAADQAFGRGGNPGDLSGGASSSGGTPSLGYSSPSSGVLQFDTPFAGSSASQNMNPPGIRPVSGRYEFNAGTSDVPGKGSSKVDSVPAKLAPGEAVLNAAAAEHLGRSTIDFLNAIGAHRMGLVGAQPDTRDVSTPAKGSKDDSGQKVNNQSGGTPGYKAGTSKVPAKGKGKSSPSPTLPPPEVMQALMAMQGGQQGGGMPQGQGMAPMPMAMPPLGGR